MKAKQHSPLGEKCIVTLCASCKQGGSVSKGRHSKKDGGSMVVLSRAMQITETKAIASEVAICGFKEVLLEADCQGL